MPQMTDQQVREAAQRLGVTESWLRYLMQSDTFDLDNPMFAKAWKGIPSGKCFRPGSGR